MKAIIRIVFGIAIFLALTGQVLGQLSTINFDGVSYDFISVYFNNNNNNVKNDLESELSRVKDLFVRSMEDDDYEAYRAMFVDGECYVSLEDYVKWREQMEGVEVKVSAVYKVQGEKRAYYFIAYDYVNYLGLFRLGVGMKETPQGPRFLALEDGLSIQQPKEFFSRVSPDVFNDLLQQNTGESNPIRKANAVSDQAVDAQKILNMDRSKYEDDKARESVEMVFLPYYENINNNPDVERRISNLTAYVDQLNLSNEDKKSLKLMVEDYRIAKAALEIATRANVPQEEVYQVFEGSKTDDE